MHGLIFVTWEKYLGERFGTSLLNTYRRSIGETPATSPLTSRVYSDAVLLTGVEAASKLTHVPADNLLRGYGRYFIINGLTSHLCSYLLQQVHSGRELLLAMRDAHAQMGRLPDGLTPPIFAFEMISTNPNELALIYDSNRHLCPVLWGAITGAAERYGERVQIVERTCMRNGAAACRFEMCFITSPSGPLQHKETAEQRVRREEHQKFADLVLSVLPHEGGLKLADLQMLLWHRNLPPNMLRPTMMLTALKHLQYAGLVASSAGEGDDLAQRRYWRAPTA
jgi:hypothetical protein